MKDRSRDHLSPALLAAYVDGEVTPCETAAVARLLETSPEARVRVHDLRRIREVLETSPPELKRLDLAGRVRAAAAREAQAPPVRWPARWLGFGLGAAAACAALVAVVVRRAPPVGGAGGDFTVKSAAVGARTDAERWAGIRVYQPPARPGGEPRPVGSVLPGDTGLLFSYNNLGPRPFTHLMIFSRDSAGDVRWFFPAYERAGSNPRSIAIAGPGADVPLGELVRQALHPGSLSLFALFTRRPLGVAEVEAWLGVVPTSSTGPLPASWGDAYLQRIVTAVAP
jgi:hypothetical protein